MESDKRQREFRPLRRPYPDMRPDEDNFSYFRRTDRFSDFVLIGSATIEFFLNESILQIYNLPRPDKRAEQLLSHLNLYSEIQILWTLGKITKTEFRVLEAFRTHRNLLIHNLEQTRFFSLTKEMKEKHMNVIEAALDVISQVFSRVSTSRAHPTKVNTPRNDARRRLSD